MVRGLLRPIFDARNRKYIADIYTNSIKLIIFTKISNILPMGVKQIGLTIAGRREFLQLRQEDLSEMSGVAIKTIHLIETGSGNPSIVTLEKIATVLGLELLLQIKKLS